MKLIRARDREREKEEKEENWKIWKCDKSYGKLF